MKALTLWQPWATLVAIGAKSIETRSWSTDYRGPIAIHAAKTTKGFDSLDGDCEGNTEAGWRYGYIGDYQAGYCFSTSDEGQRGDTFLVDLEPSRPTMETTTALGAVVALADLAAIIPTEWITWTPPGGIAGRQMGHRRQLRSCRRDRAALRRLQPRPVRLAPQRRRRRHATDRSSRRPAAVGLGCGRSTRGGIAWLRPLRPTCRSSQLSTRRPRQRSGRASTASE